MNQKNRPISIYTRRREGPTPGIIFVKFHLDPLSSENRILELPLNTSFADLKRVTSRLSGLSSDDFDLLFMDVIETILFTEDIEWKSICELTKNHVGSSTIRLGLRKRESGPLPSLVLAAKAVASQPSEDVSQLLHVKESKPQQLHETEPQLQPLKSPSQPPTSSKIEPPSTTLNQSPLLDNYEKSLSNLDTESPLHIPKIPLISTDSDTLISSKDSSCSNSSKHSSRAPPAQTTNDTNPDQKKDVKQDSNARSQATLSPSQDSMKHSGTVGFQHFEVIDSNTSFAQNLTLLKHLGHLDEERNRELLIKHKGDVGKVVSEYM